MPRALRFSCLPCSISERAALIRRALAAMALGDKPLWAVRYGWNRAPNGAWGAVTPQAQAAYAVDAMDLAWRRWPWLEALGWAVDRPAAAPGDPRWGFALSAPDGAPAPVLAALAQWLAAPRAPLRAEALGLTAPWPWLAWLLLVGGLAAVTWRSAAAARLLPWAQWLRGWRGLPWPLHLAAWGGLLLLYYLAVWPPLVGLCWLLWGLLFLAEPRVGLALAAALLPFYFQHKDLYLVDTVVPVPPAAAAAVCLLPSVLLRARQRRSWFGAVDAAVLGLLAASLLAGARVWNWRAYGQGLLDLVLAPLALWFAFRILDDGDDGPFAAKVGGFAYAVGLALFAGGALAGAWGLAAWFGGHGVEVDGVRRLVGPHFSPNHTALYLLRTFFLGVGLAAACSTAGADKRAQGLGILLWAATALVLLALVLTGSRGALLLGLPLGILVVAWGFLRRRPALLSKPHTHAVTRWVLLGVCLAGAAAFLLLRDRLFNYQTFNLRVDLWGASLRLWRDHLLLGVGPGGFFWTYPAYLEPSASVEPNQLHPHNVWLEVVTTWGLLGAAWLGLLLWSVAAYLKTAVRRCTQPAPVDWFGLGLAAALLAAFAHAQVDAFFLLPDLAAWNALALALLISRCEHPYSAGYIPSVPRSSRSDHL